jgi:hypothetical protein
VREEASDAPQSTPEPCARTFLCIPATLRRSRESNLGDDEVARRGADGGWVGGVGGGRRGREDARGASPRPRGYIPSHDLRPHCRSSSCCRSRLFSRFFLALTDQRTTRAPSRPLPREKPCSFNGPTLADDRLDH